MVCLERLYFFGSSSLSFESVFSCCGNEEKDSSIPSSLEKKNLLTFSNSILICLKNSLSLCRPSSSSSEKAVGSKKAISPQSDFDSCCSTKTFKSFFSRL
eukprot:Lithocolla_globosa_v1_NODE_1513_length_2520_cov_11.413793.p3 type:complete len:100 gc:universal NODE_1513_length_2520_cov_11.413793:2116-2415(+)